MSLLSLMSRQHRDLRCPISLGIYIAAENQFTQSLHIVSPQNTTVVTTTGNTTSEKNINQFCIFSQDCSFSILCGNFKAKVADLACTIIPPAQEVTYTPLT